MPAHLAFIHRIHARRSLLATLLATVACSSLPQNHSDPDASTGSDAASDTAPKIVSLSSTVSSITAGGSFTIVAVVTEPTGLSNLAGGKLTSDDGTVTYGAFVAVSPGTYSLTITWDQVNAGQPINFVGKVTSSFRATFYDTTGASTSQAMPVMLYCGAGADPDAACAGRCTRLDSTTECGACNAQCVAPTTTDLSQLSAVSCHAATACEFSGQLLSVDATNHPKDSCSTECAAAAAGGTCVAASATMDDGSTKQIGCGDSLTSYQPTSTITLSNFLDCQCQTAVGTKYFQPKEIAGSCAFICGGPTYCVATVFGDRVDTCSAPYLFQNWDLVAPSTADPVAVTVAVRPRTLACTCDAPGVAGRDPRTGR
jgi:hypothetical protein